MFGKEKDSLNFKSKNYKIKDNYKTDNLVVANLQYISSKIEDIEEISPMIETTTQKYLFEIINNKNKIRYREVFTGFIADDEQSGYFDLPYVVNIVPLKEKIDSNVDSIPKYGLLLTMNEINEEKTKEKLK